MKKLKKHVIYPANPEHIMHKPIQLKHVIYTIIIGLALVIVMKQYVIMNFRLSGESMLKTLQPEEMLLIDKISFHIWDDLKRGDVVVVKTDKSELKEFYVKRIIGMPGDEIRIMSDYVFLFNKDFPKGVLIQEPYTDGQPTEAKTAGDIFKLASNEYLVMGDNRPHSEDGRNWGPLKRNQIEGRVVWKIWWPVEIKKPIYTELGETDSTIKEDIKNKMETTKENVERMMN